MKSDYNLVEWGLKGKIMNDIFKMEGPIMSFLTKAADLIWLNLLFIIFSLPVFTIGASYTALYYVSMKMVKNEEGYITKDFFRAFKNNFRQSTIIWLMMMTVICILGLNFYILRGSTTTVAKVVFCLICMISFVVAMILLYVFALLARFENKVMNTIVNSFLISLTQVPKSLMMLVFSLFPIILVRFNLKWLPLLLFLGFSLVAYTNSHFMVTIFKKFEGGDETETDETETSEIELAEKLLEAKELEDKKDTEETK